MNSVRLRPALAGAAALALVLSVPAIAQQQQSTGEQGQAAQATQEAATPQNTAESARNSGAAGQVVQRLEEAQQALEQDDMDAAREALGQAHEALQKAAVEGPEEQLLEVQAQLQQAETALQSDDAETAQAAIGKAAETLVVIEQESAEAGKQDSKQAKQATGTQSGQQAQQTQQSPTTMAQGQQQPMQGVSQEAIWSAQDALQLARQEVESAMRSIEEAEAALQQLGAGMASGQGNARVTVVEGDQTKAEQNQQAMAPGTQVPGRDVSRMSEEETRALLGVGDRQIGEAAEMLTLTVKDLSDRDVITYDGKEVGEIEQVVSSGGQIYAIIEHGGFLGIGESEVAIPVERLGMLGEDIVLLGLTEEQIERMPDYDFEADEELSREDAIEIGRYN